jgi:hypothetical protein
MTVVYVFVTKTFVSIEFFNSFKTVFIARHEIISFSVFIKNALLSGHKRKCNGVLKEDIPADCLS